MSTSNHVRQVSNTQLQTSSLSAESVTTELLKALKAARAALRLFHDASEEANDSTMRAVGRTIKAADAAIAKAEGSQP